MKSIFTALLLIFTLWSCNSADSATGDGYDTASLKGDWIDSHDGEGSWGFLSLHNAIGDKVDSFYRVDNGEMLMFRAANDPSNPARGHRWYEGGKIVKADADSLVFSSPEMDKIVRMYRAKTPPASADLEIESISLGGNAWNLPYTEIRMEIRKDGDVFLQGLDRSKRTVNLEGRISLQMWQFYADRIKLADPTSMKPYYECGCVVAKRDTLAIVHNGTRTHSAFYGFDDVPAPINGLFSLLMRTPNLVPLQPGRTHDYPALRKD